MCRCRGQAADYVELLPAEWRRINEDGITHGNRVYDCAELNPYRRTGSGVQSRGGRWEVHYDPYDVTAVWVRNHHHGGWITAGLGAPGHRQATVQRGHLRTCPGRQRPRPADPVR